MINIIDILPLIKMFKKESPVLKIRLFSWVEGMKALLKRVKAEEPSRYVHFKCVPCVLRVTWFTQNICSQVKNRTHNLHACASSVQSLQKQISTLLKKNRTETWPLEFASIAWWSRVRVRRKTRDKNWDNISGGLCRCYECCTCPAV